MGSAPKGIDRPATEDTAIGKQFIDLLGKADTRTQQIFDMIQPLLGTAQGQANDVLAGLAGPFAPATQAAVGSGRQALSQSLTQNQDAWNRAGITGTDYAQLTANQIRQGEQQLAGIPSTFTQPLLAQIFGALTGSQAQAIQGQGQTLGSAAGVTERAISPIQGRTAAEIYSEAFKNIGQGIGSVYPS